MNRNTNANAQSTARSATMKQSMKHLAAALALCLPFAAGAHDVWSCRPSTVLSGADSWITVDAAVGNDKFHFNHAPLRLDGLAVTAPDGSAAEAEKPQSRQSCAAPSTCSSSRAAPTAWPWSTTACSRAGRKTASPSAISASPRAWPRPCLPRPTSWKSRKAWAASRPSSPPASPAPSSPWAEAWNWRPSRTRTTCTRARPPPSRCCWTASPPRTWK